MTDTIQMLANIFRDDAPKPTKVDDDVYIPVVVSEPEPTLMYLKYEDFQEESDFGNNGSGDFRIK